MNTEIKNMWRKKSWSIPDLLGSKSEYTKIVIGLIQQIASGNANGMDDFPKLEGVFEPRTWREYVPFLKGIGIVGNHNGSLCLSETGEWLHRNLSFYNIASVMQERFRIFGEILYVLDSEPSTVQEVDEKICDLYKLKWKNCSNTRKRMDWLEVLGLIDIIGNRKWVVTESGKRALKEWILVTPEMLDSFEDAEVSYKISEAPTEISNMIQELYDNNLLQKERCTYNLWSPSPNKIENLRKILEYSCEKVTRIELFKYIGDEFNLKVSSIESMMPFLKASGLLEEVGRNIYITSSVAKEWCETGVDIDFIRILHCHYRFVGEMILFAENDVTRNEIYQEAKEYGLNNEKARWIAGFLVEAGLLEEPQYLHLKARKKVALITDQELIDIAKKAEELGLNLQEIAIIFQSPDGKSRLQELISTKQREQNLIELIVATFRKEQEMLESISARDMFLLLRMTDNSPSLEEILNVFSLLSTDEIDVLEMNKQASAKENTTYTMKNAKATVNRLKMIANAIEKGIEK